MYKIPLIRPYLSEELKTFVGEVLDSRIWTEGAVTRDFEKSIGAFTGSKHAIAVCNCTVGLELALRAMGVGPGDEVIVPDYTYPATASAVQIVGATIVLVDVDPKTMLIDYKALESAITQKTKVVMPVSLFGNPLDYHRLHALKQKYGFWIVEDAACALGAEYKNAKVGNLSDISVFSFHPRKFISTGEGGMITTQRDDWALWMDSYKHFGMEKSAERESISFTQIGTNYKLSNLQAAVGLYQMKVVDQLLSKRRFLARQYESLLADTPGICFPNITEGGISSYQSFCILVEKRARLLQALRAKGIEVQIGTYALHQQPAYQNKPYCRIPAPLSGSQTAYEKCLTLPMYHDMTEDEQRFVVDSLKATLKTLSF